MMDGGRGAPIDVWTPRAVRDALIEAVTWVRYETGPAGPSGFRGCMPLYRATLEDHLAEGWGLPEAAGDERFDERPLRIAPTPERVQQLTDALGWAALYLGEDHPGSARMLALWLKHRTKGGGHGFDPAVRRLGISRGYAYRLRDRALSLIAQGLTADGVRLW